MGHGSSVWLLYGNEVHEVLYGIPEPKGKVNEKDY
jgi:hypothetical protein